MDDLDALIERGDVRDRAFVDANLRMAWSRAADGAARAEIEARHRRLALAAHRAHAPLRAEIASGAHRGVALRRRFEDVPSSDRDHFVEEVLGVAYPPLDERALERELVSYTPSGWEEIVHAFDVTKLGSGDRFLDIGAGAGKVALLAAVLCGATTMGIECELPLVSLSRAAAADLGLDAVVRFEHGDARTAPIEHADVVFMYVPFTGETFAGVMKHVVASGPRFVCSAPLDLTRLTDLDAIGPACSWLQVYALR